LSHNRRTQYVYLLIFLVVMTLPYGLMYLDSPVGYTFTGFLSLSEDDMTYLTKMRQGFEGSWLYRNPYTPEFSTEPGQPIFFLYLFLGQAARWLHVPLVTAFHVSRVVMGLLLAVVVFRLLVAVVSEEHLVLTLATFGAGLEWVTYFTPSKLFFIPVAEAYVFSSALFYPHFLAAMLSYLLLIGVLVFEWPESGSTMAGVALLLAGLVLTGIHPYMWLVVVVVVMATHLVERHSITRLYWAIPWLIPAGIYAVYMLRLFLTSPVLSSWRAETTTRFNVYWLLMLSPLMFAALIGLPKAWRTQPYGRRLVVWAVTQGLLLFLPISFSRRLVEGWGLPLGALAGIGLVVAWRKGSVLPRVLALVAGCLLLVTPLISVVRPLIAPIPTQYVSTWVRSDALMLFGWLEDEVPEGTVVLCSPALGNQVPAYTGRTVVMGHWSETIRSVQKAELWRQLVAGEVTANEALREYPATHIVADSDVLRSTMDVDPRLRKVYEHGIYSVYVVTDR